jgi:hypothetical protein
LRRAALQQLLRMRKSVQEAIDDLPATDAQAMADARETPRCPSAPPASPTPLAEDSDFPGSPTPLEDVPRRKRPSEASDFSTSTKSSRINGSTDSTPYLTPRVANPRRSAGPTPSPVALQIHGPRRKPLEFGAEPVVAASRSLDAIDASVDLPFPADS